jgi:hypothetical protein
LYVMVIKRQYLSFCNQNSLYTHWFIIDIFIQRVLCFVFICLHSYRASIYMWIRIMYSFIPPFHEAKFCDVPSRVFDKLGCVVGEKSLRNTVVGFKSPDVQ